MIHLSQAAIAEISRMKFRQRHPNSWFRIAVQVGGCADLYYTMELSEAPKTEDVILDQDGIQVAIDSSSIQYLHGLTIDYSEDLMGGGFRFHNPNASKSCGCGNSFVAAES
jgi:iron-sulfur cluster assembly protein